MSVRAFGTYCIFVDPIKERISEDRSLIGPIYFAVARHAQDNQVAGWGRVHELSKRVAQVSYYSSFRFFNLGIAFSRSSRLVHALKESNCARIPEIQANLSR